VTQRLELDDDPDLDIVKRATPLARKVGAILYRDHAPYDESVNGMAWQIIDAEAVIAAGPDLVAIEAALRDTGLLLDHQRPSSALLAELAQVIGVP
jgi:hypothetical protein